MTRADFNDFVKRISRKLYVNAYRFLKDQEGAEDAVQEVFIRLWSMNSRLAEYYSVEALALTMTRNYCIDQIRKNKNIEKENSGNESFYQETEPSPHEKMEIAEITSIIDGIIEKLPEIYRKMIQMRDIEGLAYEEIALKTDQNINTLRVKLSRARKIIRNEFEKYMYEKR